MNIVSLTDRNRVWNVVRDANFHAVHLNDDQCLPHKIGDLPS